MFMLLLFIRLPMGWLVHYGGRIGSNIELPFERLQKTHVEMC